MKEFFHSQTSVDAKHVTQSFPARISLEWDSVNGRMYKCRVPFVMRFLLLPPLGFSHASCCVCNRCLAPSPAQVPAPVDRRVGDLPDQPGRDRVDVFKLRPAASLPHLLPPGEQPAYAGGRLPL